MNTGDIETLLIHGGVDGDIHTGAVTVPIYQTATYRQRGLGDFTYEYSRTGNPTREALEKQIAVLEGTGYGLAFASGMAAITAVLGLLEPGNEILITSNVYGGSFRVLDTYFKSFGIRYKVVDTSDLAKTEAAFGPSTRMILLESPANPLLTVSDIKAISGIAHKKGALVIVDNTFMSPYLQRPAELGADIVVHSATKYIGGHSDVVAGLVALNDKALADRLYFLQNSTGGVPGPFDCYLLLRGLKTLAVRMDRHCENAAAVADHLLRLEGVQDVHYPGLASHPGHGLQSRQAAGPGGMVSFTLAGGYSPAKFFKALRVFALAESLGGVESLACHPASMTHAAIPRSIREQVGITENLVRLSVGIEGQNALLTDLEQAVRAAKENQGNRG